MGDLVIKPGTHRAPFTPSAPPPMPPQLAIPLTWKNRLRFIRLAFTTKSEALLDTQPHSPLSAFKVSTPPLPILTPIPPNTPPPPPAHGTSLLVRLIGRRHMNGVTGAEEHKIHLHVPLTREIAVPAICLATKAAIHHSDIDPSLIETAHIFINPPLASQED